MAEQRLCDEGALLQPPSQRTMLMDAGATKDSYMDTNGALQYGPRAVPPNNNLCAATTTLTDSYATRGDDPLSVDCVDSGGGDDDDALKDESQDSADTASSTSQNSEYKGGRTPDDLHSSLVSPDEGPGTSPLLQRPESDKTERAAYDGDAAPDYSNGALAAPKVRKRQRNSGGRGRPRKAQLVPMYHSQISGDKDAIKIRIKKSNLSPNVQLTPNKKKTGRRKKHKTSDTDVSDYESGGVVKRSKNHDPAASAGGDEPHEQSRWALEMPQQALHLIFQHAVAQDGALPTLVRLCKVCRLWREVALTQALWRRVDLNWVKERARTDLHLHWLIQNRLTHCEDLSMGEWKLRDIQLALEAVAQYCPDLRAINLSGWKGLNADNLKYITTECENLQRLDLSSINSTSAINAQPLVHLGQTMNSRLTHLILAHNKIAGFTQIIASIASNCPNLELLDISNIRTFAHNTALLHVEKLQSGCPKLRVLRITNSQIWLAPASITDQVASPGFPALEELSLAGIEDEQTTTARCVDDEGIERILKGSTKLRLLDIRGCIKLTDSGLVKVPAWDLEHLFLSACCITRTQNSGLELIVQKWSHSLLEVDLAWSTATASLDAAVLALAEKGDESPLRTINLCGSSVSLEPVKAILRRCPCLHSLNLQSCRGLPRGIKRLYTGAAVAELRQSLQDKPKVDEADAEGSTDRPSSDHGSQ